MALLVPELLLDLQEHGVAGGMSFTFSVSPISVALYFTLNFKV
jgi:hypothetical protein